MSSSEGVTIMPSQWFLKSVRTLKLELNTDEHKGLSAREVKKRLHENGENKLKEKKRESALRVFLHQFEDFMVLVLIGTTIISALLGEMVDALAILAIILMNAV